MSRKYYDFGSETESFPSYLTFSNILGEEEVNEIFNWTNDNEWQQSEVYNVGRKSNELNLNTRKSFKTKITSAERLKYLDQTLIAKINSLAQNVSLRLVYDDIELIKYVQGGYFKEHQDFVHYISNQIKCYTLIYCVKGACEGGETMLYLSDTEEIKCPETKTSNDVLIMRNEVLHAGSEVVEGEKIVLKLNLLALKTDEQVIRILFKNDERMYYVDRVLIDKWPDSYLAGALRFDNKQDIMIEACTYEEFSVIYQLLIRQQPMLKIVNAHQHLFDYFGYNFEMERTLYDHCQQQFEASVERIDNFLSNRNHKDCFFVASSTNEYHQFKSYFAANPNILSVQWVYDEKGIILICIAGTLVYFKYPNTNVLANNRKEGKKEFEESICQYEKVAQVKMLKRLLRSYEIELSKGKYRLCKKCIAKQEGKSIEEIVELYKNYEERNGYIANEQDEQPEQNENHRQKCLYSEIKYFIAKLLYFTGDELSFCKYLMQGLLEFTAIYHEEDYYEPFQNIILNTKILDRLNSLQICPLSLISTPNANPQRVVQQICKKCGARSYSSDSLTSGLCNKCIRLELRDVVNIKAAGKAVENKLNIKQIQTIFPQIQDYITKVVLIKSKKERVIGVYECNEASYYEQTSNLGLGFINLEKYV